MGRRWVIAVVYAWLAASLLPRCTPQRDHPGRVPFERACSRCHPLERPLAKHKSRAGWERTVAVMRQLGADLTDEEALLVTDYLSELRPPEL